MKSHKPSIRSLAAASGYSVATVSMALRGLGRIPPETRKKIEEVAAASGYMRDLEMSRLMSRARHPAQAVDREVLAFLAEVPLGPKPDPRSPWLHNPSVGVIGHDDIWPSRMMRPALTTVRQPMRKMGVAAPDLLLDSIEGNPVESPIIFQARLIERDTTPQKPQT